MEILVSIIIPVYNGEKFLKETIESCLNQTFVEKIEIIIVDDCSKDDSVKIIKGLLSPHIRFIQNDINLGLMKTNNKAVEMARGKYLLFLGHDDVLVPKHVEIMFSELDENTAILHCNANLINENNKIFGRGVNDIKQRYRNFFIKYYLSLGNVIHSTGALVSHKHLKLVNGWDETYKNYGEWLLWCKLMAVGEIKYTTSIRALYRKHATNITNTFVKPEVQRELHQYALLCKKEGIKNIHNALGRWLVTTINKYRENKVK